LTATGNAYAAVVIVIRPFGIGTAIASRIANTALVACLEVTFTYQSLKMGVEYGQAMR
jgi:hypothetical protein